MGLHADPRPITLSCLSLPLAVQQWGVLCELPLPSQQAPGNKQVWPEPRVFIKGVWHHHPPPPSWEPQRVPRAEQVSEHPPLGSHPE